MVYWLDKTIHNLETHIIGVKDCDRKKICDELIFIYSFEYIFT